MLTIITGDDIEAINKQKYDEFSTTVLRDTHPKILFEEVKRIVEVWSDSDSVHNVITYNINNIQALYYFAHKLGKPDPNLLYYHNGKKESIDLNQLDEVFNNLMAPMCKLFEGR